MARFLSTRTNEIKKQQEADKERYIKAMGGDTVLFENAQLINLAAIYGELRSINETLAMTCDYLGTIANTLYSNTKGGK